LHASRVDRRRAADHFTEDVVERSENLAALRVVRARLLLDFLRMTGRTLLGRDDGGYVYRLAVVRHVSENAFITFLAVMAVVAIDAGCAVSALLPLAVHAGGDLRVTGGAILADRGVERGLLRFGRFGGRA